MIAILYTSSRTRPGMQYQLRFMGKEWCCTCPGYGYRGTCRHVKALAEFCPAPIQGGAMIRKEVTGE